MSPNALLIIVGAVILIVWWQLATFKNKVICTYTRPSKQQITKLAKLTDKTVVFDHLEFKILPDRAIHRWYKLLWGLLGDIGTWVIAYEFTWDSQYPRDPNQQHPTSVITPAIKHIINNEDRMNSFARGVDKQAGKKTSPLEKWLPIVAIVAVIVVGVYFYNQNQMQNAQLQGITQAIHDLNK